MSHDLHIDSTINEAVRKLCAEGYARQEIHAGVDRIVDEITAEAARRVFAPKDGPA